MNDVFHGISKLHRFIKPVLDMLGLAYLAEDAVDYLSVYPQLFTRNMRSKYFFLQYLLGTTSNSMDQLPPTLGEAFSFVLRSDSFNQIIIVMTLVALAQTIWLTKDLNTQAIPAGHMINDNAEACIATKAGNDNTITDEDSEVVTTDETSEASVRIESEFSAVITEASLAAVSTKSSQLNTNWAKKPLTRGTASSPSTDQSSKRKAGVRLDMSGNSYQPATSQRKLSPTIPSGERKLQPSPRHSILKNSPGRPDAVNSMQNSSPRHHAPGSVSGAGGVGSGKISNEMLQHNTDLNSLNTLSRSAAGRGVGGSDNSSSNGSSKGRLEYIQVLSPRQNKELEEETVGTPYSRVMTRAANGGSVSSSGGRKLLLGIGELGAGSDDSGNSSSSSDDDINDNDDTSSRAGSVRSERSVMSIRSIQSNGDEHVSTQQTVMDSVENPKVLIGWRVLIKGYGMGIVVSLKKQRFATTQFNIKMENGSKVTLPLKRSAKKGSVPFTLITKLK